MVIRTQFEHYRGQVKQALNPLLAVGALLARIKAGITNGHPGFPDTNWRPWCEQAHADGELPFGVRQADEYVRCWSRRRQASRNGGSGSLREEIRLIRGEAVEKKRERWRKVKLDGIADGLSDAGALEAAGAPPIADALLIAALKEMVLEQSTAGRRRLTMPAAPFDTLLAALTEKLDPAAALYLTAVQQAVRQAVQQAVQSTVAQAGEPTARCVSGTVEKADGR